MGYAKCSNIQTWTPQHHSCLNPLNAVSSKTEVAIWVNFIDMILKERIDESKSVCSLAKRHRWTNLKKTKTDCNCGFLKTYPNSFFNSFLLFVKFDYDTVDCKTIHIFQIFKYVRAVKQKVLSEAEIQRARLETWATLNQFLEKNWLSCSLITLWIINKEFFGNIKFHGPEGSVIWNINKLNWTAMIQPLQWSGHRHLVAITMLSWKHCSHKPVFHCILVELLLLTTKILLAASMTPFQSAPFTVTVPKWMSSFCSNNVTLSTVTYHINTNAIPGELSHENMISSHVKITCYLTWKDHCSEMIWYFTGVYIINKTLHGHLKIQNFSSSVEKYFTRLLRSLFKYFSTLASEKFCIFKRPCNILYTSNKLLPL